MHRYPMIHLDTFFVCPQLTKVDLAGGIHKTVDKVHLESWKNGMREEINRINQVL